MTDFLGFALLLLGLFLAAAAEFWVVIALDLVLYRPHQGGMGVAWLLVLLLAVNANLAIWAASKRFLRRRG